MDELISNDTMCVCDTEEEGEIKILFHSRILMVIKEEEVASFV